LKKARLVLNPTQLEMETLLKHQAACKQRFQHCTQRIALIRHALHAAIRTKDFGGFKTLQAKSLFRPDYVAIVHGLFEVECDANPDFVINSLDELNSALCYVHQDAAKVVYDRIRSGFSNSSGGERSTEQRLMLIRVDISQQAQIADSAVDRIVSSAISLIESQRTPQIQEARKLVDHWCLHCIRRDPGLSFGAR
jgi:hypothetical protein